MIMGISQTSIIYCWYTASNHKLVEVAEKAETENISQNKLLLPEFPKRMVDFNEK